MCEDDGRDAGRRGVVRIHAGDVAQDALGDQLLGRALRRAAREVAAVRRRERHAEVEQDARAADRVVTGRVGVVARSAVVDDAVVGRDLDAHAADLAIAAVDEVSRGQTSDARARTIGGLAVDRTATTPASAWSRRPLSCTHS